MADGKWITELTAQTPLADAARRVLSVRLEVVRDYLPLAMRRSDDDIEFVHQLRVGTRRAGAALEIFSLCLPDKDYRTARKYLRRIRRAAGEARDWDVFLAGMAAVEATPQRRQPALDLLVGQAVALRIAAQVHLDDASPNYPFDFERFLAETVAAVHKPRGQSEKHTLLDLAEPMLSSLLAELHEATTGDLTDYAHLHHVRIIGKRLRYAMEIFVDCFAPAFREQLYPQVEKMQDILGVANDSFVASQRLGILRDRLRVLRAIEWRRYKPGLDELRRWHDQRLVQQRQLFEEWWKGWQESGGEQAFSALLKHEDAPALPAESETPSM